MRVCVIGAGVSGLVTAKTFLRAGHEVVVYEKDEGLGGVWGTARAYAGLQAQNPRDTYSFSDHPMPRDFPEWLTAAHVREYLRSYAERFEVLERVQLSRLVVAVRRVGAGASARWEVRTAAASGGDERVERFDKVMVCNGIHCAPNVPEIPGRAAFERAGGTVLHSSQVTEAAQLRGKRVVVVGFGKSACDLAMLGLDVGSACTVVYRRAHWKVPSYWFGVINYKYILMARHSELLFRYYKMSAGERLLHSVGRPVIRMMWRAIEGYLKRRQHLAATNMLPPASMQSSANCNTSLESDGFFDAVNDGRMGAHKGEIVRYHAGELELDDGGRVPADVVVFGTGWIEGAPFVEDRFRERFTDGSGYIHLYRQILHPDVPDMAFIGYNSSFHGQLSSEIAARWVLEVHNGRARLPSRREMLREAEAVLEWRAQERPIGRARGTCVIPFDTHYIDQLMRDMGLNPKRFGANFIKEWLLPVTAAAYAGLDDELDAVHGPAPSA